MCHWMGSHCHDWIDYNGVAFSIELLEWGHTLSFVEFVTVMRIHASPHALSGVHWVPAVFLECNEELRRLQADLPKTRVAKPYNRNQKLRMKSLWHPGYK